MSVRAADLPVAPRGGRRPAFAAVTILLLALIGPGWLAASDAEAKGGEVTVRAAGDSPASVSVTLSELGAPDVNNRDYRLRTGSRKITGHSIARVLEEAASKSDDIDIDRIPYVEVDRVGAGAPISLTSRQINSPGAFADGPPVFFEEDGATVFVKPGSGSGSGSTVRFANAPIGVTIGVADDLAVGLEASSRQVDAGDSVRFRATVEDPPSGQALEYRWSFGDGRSRASSKASVTHTYGKKGSYLVVVTATAGGASGQGSGAVEVGKDEPKKNSGKNSGDDGTGGGASGGSGSGSGYPYEGSYGGSGYGADYGAPGDYGYDYGTSQPGNPVYPAAPPAANTPLPQTAPPAPVDDGLTPVSGELVSGTAPAPVATIPPPGGGDTIIEPAAPASDPAGIPSAVWMIGGALFLVALGGLSEIRAFSRFQG
ncbi:MAG: PKD domain-containing protein [Thermoleophilia bacterium]|nr:PKD domain-containing protein [Thermoleophilia bacterium]